MSLSLDKTQTWIIVIAFVMLVIVFSWNSYRESSDDAKADSDRKLILKISETINNNLSANNKTLSDMLQGRQAEHDSQTELLLKNQANRTLQRDNNEFIHKNYELLQELSQKLNITK